MKKNKKMVYFLVMITMVIWGTVISKIVSNFKGDPQAAPIQTTPILKIEEPAEDSLYVLNLNYPDPFLKQEEQVIKSKPQGKVISWPSTEYKGLLLNNLKKEGTGFLKMQGKDLLVKQGKSYSGVQISAITKDSILLVFMDEKKWVKRGR